MEDRRAREPSPAGAAIINHVKHGLGVRAIERVDFLLAIGRVGRFAGFDAKATLVSAAGESLAVEVGGY